MSSSAASSAVRARRPGPRHSRKGRSPGFEFTRAGIPSAISEAVRQPIFPLARTLNDQTYNIIQSAAAPVTVTSSSVAATFGTVNFILNLIDQVTQLTSIFDQYRIRMVEVAFHPRVSVSAPTVAANTGLFTTVIDVDDSAVLTTIGQAQDYSSAVTGRGIDSQRRTLVPHAAIAAYSGAFTSFANERSPWLDAASPGVIHYGMKTAWSITDVAYTIDISVRYWLEFRNVR